MSKHILFITSGQPAINPRLVKEADALADAGYTVTVLYAYWNDWATGYDEQLIATKKWKAHRVAGHPVEQPFTYFLSRFIHKLAVKLSRYTTAKCWHEYAIARGSFYLIRKAKKIKADLYIGHNLGALPATVIAANAHNKLCGFDAEDYHRNEISDDKNNNDVVLRTYLENKYVPQLNYLTASSPFIAAQYQQHYPQIKKEVVLNVFSNKNIKPIEANPASSLKLFWFSQTIGAGRGLEEVVEALCFLNTHAFELHLLGDLPAGTFKSYLAGKEEAESLKIFTYPPISPDEIVAFASKFDIGLSAETRTPFNRDICLTNKLFTYLQAGLAVVASSTTAQQAFIYEHLSIGKVYTDAASLAKVLVYYHENRVALADAKKEAWELAGSAMNWEAESKKFIKVVTQTLGQIE
ncbi:MAG: hypothetical protein EOP47_12900 [Sphingobacteriaceae bacterium]|nr:MAG: hypothetical protein EOP47_12900 [Sphingobacteriaceae bacterium]